MKTTRKTSDSRERDLRLALARIQRGRAHTGESKVTIAAVAREAGVSTALIHNHYPNVAEAVREAQGRSSRAQRDVKHQDLIAEREKNKLLRQELEELRLKTADLASINEVLMAELRALKARSGDLKIVALPSHKT
ncbi:TPA: TetR family transcriptional regulator [Pseudomonas putida]|uniref:TetR family transcriptional regulator n=2 Tax=Pseudomonas gessardii TaxID=78544 RepID=A0ABS9F442_9PSED|nr:MULTISPECIES: TetR family transcriptional regulator [Pseudomonas]KRC89035.1 TetR family transcriptional regulator [Pseudomonas sp. Root9]MBD8706056.1 TetR family transcriptional regulator [Pseudomonas sp. CFBP 13711]MBD8711954.1 TetR family transcriptional regulator [Pseudomonas sp. CFBP 13715]MCF4981840.1 TetR family transcriptional regulator [Pseudomonas gessardii]MCF4992698.1 TetR family transcriptional regulator [Pseudomonas gessardii]